MVCSRSVSIHLLRGFGAAVLVSMVVLYGSERIWILLPSLLGALVLLRGCPMCWLMGLIEAASGHRDAREM